MRHIRRSTAQPTFSAFLIIVSLMILILSSPARAAEGAVDTNAATTLLAISFVLCVCILAVSGFTLSNRPIPVERVTTERAARAYESVLKHAGCTRPVRDVVDAVASPNVPEPSFR